jgi:hypothetical protein
VASVDATYPGAEILNVTTPIDGILSVSKRLPEAASVVKPLARISHTGF